MASKVQKFKHYNDEQLKMEVLNKYLSVISSTYLSITYDIPKSTIKTWATKFRKQGNLKNDIYHKKGKQKEINLTQEDWKERYEILKKYQAFVRAQRKRK